MYQMLYASIGTTGMNSHRSIDGLLFRAHRLIVPHSWRKEILDRIHESHQGIVKCKQRARDILFWPGMSSQIEDKESKCSTCSQSQRAQPKEALVIQELKTDHGLKLEVTCSNSMVHITCRVLITTQNG